MKSAIQAGSVDGPGAPTSVRQMRNKRVVFTYQLTGTGWSKARFKVGRRAVRLSASYLDDALGDLVRAVADLQAGEVKAKVSWAEEPGEFRWVFERSGENVMVRILEFDDLWTGKPDAEGRVLIAVQCRFDALRGAIAWGARAVLNEWGEAGYRSRWVEHDFPTGALAQLEAVAQNRKPHPVWLGFRVLRRGTTGSTIPRCRPSR